MRSLHLAAALAVAALLAGAPNAAGAATPKAERTAKSKECSAQADAKGLHGKERKKFRSACRRGQT